MRPHRAVGPVGAPLHAGTGHLVTDSVLGLLVGVGVVVAYLLVLRWSGEGNDGRGHDGSNRPRSDG